MSQVDGGFDLASALRQGATPMTADKASELALKTAPSVARARAASDKARSGESEALVGVWPRLDLQAGYTRLSKHDPYDFADVTSTDPNLPDFTVQSPEPILDIIVLEARVTYPVSDVFLNILPRYKAAGKAAEAQQLTAKAAGESVKLAAREAFYAYAGARAALEIARSSLAAAEAQRRDVASLVGAGALARVELMRADAVLATAGVAVARAEGGVAVARTALRSLLHTPDDQEFAIMEELTTPLPKVSESKQALYETAVRNRSELVALHTMLGVHERMVDANAADGYPKLGITGAYEFSNPNARVDPMHSEFNGSWQAGAVLSWSPNDYASSRSRASQAGADRANTLADIQALEDALRTEVGKAYEDALAAGRAMEAALTGITAAEESYRVRREQFRAGAAVATDVVDAENELRRARLELVNAAIDIRIARARLDRAVER